MTDEAIAELSALLDDSVRGWNPLALREAAWKVVRSTRAMEAGDTNMIAPGTPMATTAGPVLDRNGTPVHVGDLVRFDPAEWGYEMAPYRVECTSADGYVGPGGVNDFGSCIDVVRPWWEDDTKGRTCPECAGLGFGSELSMCPRCGGAGEL